MSGAPRKTLIVVRHGHAIDGDDDYTRTLSARGMKEVHAAGAHFRSQATRVDHILTSSAPRAAATARELAAICGFEGTIEHARELYLATPRALLHAVTRTNGAVDTLMLVGHNPGLSTFVELLTGERTNLGTAEMRSISLNVDDWSSVTMSG
jgi:phosphohistidine phosphatase